MNNMLKRTFHMAATKWSAFCADERGDSNIVAIILIILVVIAVVAIFKDGMINIMNQVMTKLQEAVA